MMILTKAWAFIKKDYLIDSSYKSSFVFSFLYSAFPLLSYYFIDRMMGGGQHIPSLQKYGGNYFAFALIGVSLTQYFMLAVRSYSNNIRSAQLAGNFEALLRTKTGIHTIIMLSPIYNFIYKLINILILFFVAGIVFKVNFSQLNIVSALITLLIVIFAFSSLGVLSASFVVIFKKGDPVDTIFTLLLSFVSGAYFPVEILPGWLQTLAKVSPLTYALDAMRLAIFQGYSIFMLKKQLVILGLFGLIFLPVSVYIFILAVNKGKKDGSLTSY